jgi:hypothetical protein
VLAYAGGSLFGRAAIEIGSRRRIRRVASFTLAMELMLLALATTPATSAALNPNLKVALLDADAHRPAYRAYNIRDRHGEQDHAARLAHLFLHVRHRVGGERRNARCAARET